MTPYQTVSQQIRLQKESLAVEIVAYLYNRQPDACATLPEEQARRQKSIRDVNYHLAFLTEAIAVSDISLFQNYIGWVQGIFARLDFGEDVLAAVLTCMEDVLQSTMQAENFDIVQQFLRAAHQELTFVRSAPDSFLRPDAPLAKLAKTYLNTLLAGERRQASQMILAAVGHGYSVAEIYLHVFQPVLYEVGCLWQINQITVAREHYCTAVTQFIMSQLYPYIFNTPRIGRTMVAACMGGELHEVGIRMVADFFEMAGWDTYYLGANVPPTDIVEITATQNASILALSTTLMPHLHHVTQTIAAIRQHPHTQHVKILVGGYPFNLSPDLWQKVGADGYAPDAKTAVSQAATLIA